VQGDYWDALDALDDSVDAFLSFLASPCVTDLGAQGYSLEDTLALLGVSLDPASLT
jgi:hypothetical protein